MLTEKLRDIYALVGELSTRMTDIEGLWYLLFTSLMHQTPREIVDAIINVHKTAEGQRQAIVAVITTLYPKDTPIRTFLGKLLEQTQTLTGRRNAAIHSVIDIAQFTVPPQILA